MVYLVLVGSASLHPPYAVIRGVLERGMADYTRKYVAGATYFFTVVTFERRGFLTTDLARECLRRAWHETRACKPFDVEALCLLDDHLHVL